MRGSGPRLRLGPSDEAVLVSGAARHGVTLDRDTVGAFRQYAELLETWSARMNLIACASAAELVERHFLDALALVPILGPARRVVDLGSGAGLPGVPLAIVMPEVEVLLVESRRRRASFLREVRRTLGLRRLEIHEGRAEDAKPGALYDAAVCRAVWSDGVALDVAAAWLDPGGRFLWMRRGAASGAEHRALTAEGRVEYGTGGGPRGAVEIYRRA